MITNTTGVDFTLKLLKVWSLSKTHFSKHECSAVDVVKPSDQVNQALINTRIQVLKIS